MPKSLALRLILFASLWMLLALAAVGLFVSNNFRNESQDRFRELVTANLYNLMGVVETGENGEILAVSPLGDSRYGQFFSGWYWQVEHTNSSDQERKSPSLSNGEISTKGAPAFNDNFQRSFLATDIKGKQILVVQSQVFLGEGDNLYLFTITGDLEPVATSISNFSNTLMLLLLAFGLGTVLVAWAVVKFGMRPITLAADQLNEIRNGERQKIEGTYPSEIVPLVEEANTLIDSNRAIVERSRAQVGNLAHALKTPVSAIRIEIDRMKGAKRTKLLGQLDEVSSQISRYLNRAMLSARHASRTSKTPALDSIQKLVRVFEKLFPDKQFAMNLNLEKADAFAGERQDLEEILGNILENAGNWADSTIELTANMKPGEDGEILTVTVDDDGPGIDAKQLEFVKKRGNRLDEAKPGTGLGLSIVKDSVEAYGGNFQLSRSAKGGLRVQLELPG